MKISREDVLRVAQLAHLELAPDEVETYRSQLDEILSYIGKLQELDVSNVEPMTQMRPRNADDPHSAASAGFEPELRDDARGPLQRGRSRAGRSSRRRQAFLPGPQGN